MTRTTTSSGQPLTPSAIAADPSMASDTSSGQPLTPSSSLASMAAQAKANRNRAVDFYRVVAMLAVAVGHWLAMVAVTGADGELVGGNALTFVPALGWATWVLQVMPLFFVVGGFSSAMSLDAHNRNAGRSQDWIAARLRRMLPPAVVLAATWLVVLAAGAAAGQLTLAMAAVHASAIPLWFLANYTIDTALAPFVLPRFRRDPRRFGALIVGVFLTFEAMRVTGVPVLPHVNWVLGWLAFQVLGMAWRDGLLPSGARLVSLAATMWAATLALVLSGGPWSISMVHAPGLEHSPTNPPSLSLMTFGAAFSLTAIALAPFVSDMLAARPKAWTAVVASNSIAMSVYLWHMTAAVIFTGALHLTVGLPSAAVGSTDWWLFKIPTVLGSMIILAPIVAIVSKVERRALLAPRRPWNGGVGSVVAVAALTSTALKLWTSGNAGLIAPSLLVLVILGHTALKSTPVDRDDTVAVGS